MQFQIVHQIGYAYSRPVFLEPHTFRLRPRVEGSQILESFRLDVIPKPEGLWPSLDAEGNAVSIAWFDGLHSHLSITARSVIAISRGNPFGFLLAAGSSSLPTAYPPDEERLLSQARHAAPTSEDDRVLSFAKELETVAGGQVLPFLWALTQRIHSGWTVIRREQGTPWPAVETFDRRSGACRDLVLLFMEACRHVGIAARFVSGYHCHLQEDAAYDLHAWAEVYLPGAGWIGYDPTLGLAIADRHISLAASISPEHAAVVAGSFRGDSAIVSMSASISICGLAGLGSPPGVTTQTQSS